MRCWTLTCTHTQYLLCWALQPVQSGHWMVSFSKYISRPRLKKSLLSSVYINVWFFLKVSLAGSDQIGVSETPRGEGNVSSFSAPLCLLLSRVWAPGMSLQGLCTLMSILKTHFCHAAYSELHYLTLLLLFFPAPISHSLLPSDFWASRNGDRPWGFWKETGTECEHGNQRKGPGFDWFPNRCPRFNNVRSRLSAVNMYYLNSCTRRV